MTQPGHPPPYVEFDPRPAPGGGKRFVLLFVAVAAVLVGVLGGVFYWIRATSQRDYDGPPELQFPENRPYR